MENVNIIDSKGRICYMLTLPAGSLGLAYE